MGFASSMRSQPSSGSGINFVMLGGLALLGLFLLIAMWQAFYTVDAGQRGVILRNGQIVGTADPGFGFKAPFIDSVAKISVQNHKATWTKMNAYSSDQQPADLMVSVIYEIDPASVARVYAEYGGAQGVESRLLTPIANRDVKIVFGQFSAVEAVRDRSKLNILALDSMMAALKNEPVIIRSLMIENIDFSPDYIKSVEQRMQAEVEVQRRKQNLEQEKIQAQITTTKAVAEAEASLAAARAQAESIRIRGEAEALAIKARGEALRDNPALIGLVQAERWNGALPTTMVPGSALPMMNVGQK